MLMLMGHEIYAAFAKRLVQLCEEKGLPERGRQAALARLCGIKPSSVNKWFNAISLPDAENLLTIATWGNTSVDWLLGGRGKKNPLDSAISDPRIAHVLKVMESMPEYKVDQAVKIIDTIAEPAPNGNPHPDSRAA